MFGQTTTTTPPPPTERGLEDLDAAALAYAARIDGLPPERRGEARDDLVRFALPFAGRLARRYRGRGEPLEDLEQVARLGLVNAVDRYDPERGSFTAYAAITIVGEIKRHFRDRTWGVHVPRRLRDLILEVGQATSALTSELSRAPTVAELSARLETPQEEILAALESAAGYSPASLNAPVGGESSAEFGDLVGESDNALESVDDRVTVSGLLHRLPWRERRILAMRFYGNQTQAEIAARFGISQMHVSRLLSRALTWLRQAMLADAAAAVAERRRRSRTGRRPGSRCKQHRRPGGGARSAARSTATARTSCAGRCWRRSPVSPARWWSTWSARAASTPAGSPR